MISRRKGQKLGAANNALRWWGGLGVRDLTLRCVASQFQAGLPMAPSVGWRQA
jgi:hypothetical protein